MSFRLEKIEKADTSLSLSGVDEIQIAVEKEHRRTIIHDVLAYKTAVEAFYGNTGKDEYHDVAHITRTLILASLLVEAAKTHGIDIDRKVVLCSLVFHDVGTNHLDDPEHGILGAEMIGDLVRGSSMFTAEQAEHIIRNVQWHNKKHNDIPRDVWTNEFLVVTNADALDLVRMPGDREIILTTLDAYNLRSVGEALYQKSLDRLSGNDFGNVLLAFEQM